MPSSLPASVLFHPARRADPPASGRRARAHRQAGADHGRALLPVAVPRGDELARLPAHLPRADGGAGAGVRARVPRRRVRGGRRARTRAAASPTSRCARSTSCRWWRSASPTSSRSRGSSRMLEAAGIPPRASDRDDAAPVHPRRRAAHLLEPAAARRASSTPSSWARPRRRTVEVVRAIEAAPGARREARRAREDPPRLRPRRATAVLPPVGAEDDAMLPAYSAIRTPHTVLARHVPHRDRARLLARVHVLRDAPLDQRRHAHRAGGAILLETIPQRRAARGARGRGGERSPEDRRASSTRWPIAGARWASRRCGPTGSESDEFVARARARGLPHAHDGDGRHERAPPRDARAPRAPQAPRSSAPSSRRSTGWTG